MENAGPQLTWNNECDGFEVPDHWPELLARLLQAAALAEQVEGGEVSLTFVDDEAIRELNRDYRGLDKPTDVLSFAMHEGDDFGIRFEEEDEEEPPDLLGDIVISIPRARQQSEEYGHSLDREAGFLFVHGFLHLLGYDHQEEEQEREMFAKQERILLEVGLTR